MGSIIRPQLQAFLGDVTCDEKCNFHLGRLSNVYIYYMCIRCTSWGLRGLYRGNTSRHIIPIVTCCCKRRVIDLCSTTAHIQSYPSATDDGQTPVNRVTTWDDICHQLVHSMLSNSWCTFGRADLPGSLAVACWCLVETPRPPKKNIMELTSTACWFIGKFLGIFRKKRVGKFMLFQADDVAIHFRILLLDLCICFHYPMCFMCLRTCFQLQSLNCERCSKVDSFTVNTLSIFFIADFHHGRKCGLQQFTSQRCANSISTACITQDVEAEYLGCADRDEPSWAWMTIFLTKWRVKGRNRVRVEHQPRCNFSSLPGPLPGRSPHRSPIGRPSSPSEDGYGHPTKSAMGLLGSFQSFLVGLQLGYYKWRLYMINDYNGYGQISSG